MNRQLAAILFSDIVGYTALMGENEAATLELVRKSREIQKPLVEKYHGAWLKEMGDGAMAQFQSALDAVKCAVEIQNAAATQLDQKLRIGIHLGDITVDNHEVYGDGVNVASRIESVAEPGSIFISEAVQGAIKGSDIHTAFRGEKKLKNVDHPVRVYQVVDEAGSPTASVRKKYLLWLAGLLFIAAFVVWKLTDRSTSAEPQTIVVLPLEMVKADSADEYLVYGIAQELIGSLGKVSALTVVNPKSTMKFAASLAPVQEAQSEFTDSDYFLSGSFEENNYRLSLDMALHNQTQQQLWSNSYQDDIANLSKLVGTITLDVARFIRVDLNESETTRMMDVPPADPELLKPLLIGINHLKKFTPEDIAIGVSYLQQAKDKDPTNSKAWSMLAEGLVYIGHSPLPPRGVWQEAKAAAERALQLDSLNAEAWAALAHTKTYFEWDYPGAVYCYNKANSINPNLAGNHYHYSWHLYLFDSLDKAVEEHELAFQLDPLDPFQAARLAQIYLIAGDTVATMNEIKRAYRLHNEYPLAIQTEARLYLELQKYDSAEVLFKKLGPAGIRGLAQTYLRSGRYDEATEQIRILEQDINSIYAVDLARIYAELDSLNKFFYYANYEPPHAFLPWLRVGVKNPKVIADPRFKELMDKMNLPMPIIQQEPARPAGGQQ